MKVYKKIMDVLATIEKFVMVVIGATVTVIAFANVLARYVFHSQLAFTEELTINIFVLMIMCGCALSTREGSMISLSLVYGLVGPKGKKIMAVIFTVLSSVFYAILGYTGFQKSLTLFAQHKITPALLIPEGLFMLALPIGCLLMILHAIEYMIQIFQTEGKDVAIEEGGKAE